MPLAITLVEIDQGSSATYVFGTLVASGNYTTGGDTLDFTSVIGQSSLAQVFVPGTGPLTVSVFGTTGDSYGFVKEPAPAAANAFGLKTGKVKINTASNTELAAGAYPARITGDTNLFFEAVFNKGL